MSFEEAQSVEAPIGPSIRRGARETISTFINQILELARIGHNRESKKDSLKAFMVLSGVLSSNVKGLKIPYNQTKEAILQTMHHSHILIFYYSYYFVCDIFIRQSLNAWYFADFPLFHRGQAFTSVGKGQFNKTLMNRVPDDVFKRSQDFNTDTSEEGGFDEGWVGG